MRFHFAHVRFRILKKRLCEPTLKIDNEHVTAIPKTLQ